MTQPYPQDFDIDLSGVTAESTYDPVPAGAYPAQCVAVEVRTSQYGNRYVKSEFEITGGQYTGRKVFENYNIEHQNPQTVEIALRAIKQWAMACGASGNERLTLAFLQSLAGREFEATLKIEQDRTGQHGPKNRIAKFAALAASAPSPVTQRAAVPAGRSAPPPAARQGAVRQPWEH